MILLYILESVFTKKCITQTQFRQNLKVTITDLTLSSLHGRFTVNYWSNPFIGTPPPLSLHKYLFLRPLVFSLERVEHDKSENVEF